MQSKHDDGVPYWPARSWYFSINPVKCQGCPYIEISQLICCANQWTGIHMRSCLSVFDHFVGLALKGLNKIDFNRKIQFHTNVLFNPFQPSIAFHIETSDLLCFAKQKIGFYMKCNTDLKYFNAFQYSTINWKKRAEAFADVFRKRCSLKFLNIHRSRRCNVPTQHYLPVQSSNLNTS